MKKVKTAIQKAAENADKLEEIAARIPAVKSSGKYEWTEEKKTQLVYIRKEKAFYYVKAMNRTMRDDLQTWLYAGLPARKLKKGEEIVLGLPRGRSRYLWYNILIA